MAAQMGKRLSRTLVLALAAAVAALMLWRPGGPSLTAADGPPDSPAADSETAEADDTEETNPLGANAACYVCHIPFVREHISKVHLKAKVTCIKCHGLSAPHANDEDIGATKPDIVFKRGQVDAMCAKCHKTHDAPAKAVVARYLHRCKSLKSAAVCTDCHGTHKIKPPPEE